MNLRFTAKVERMSSYPAASEYGVKNNLIMLASNESPYEPLPEVIADAEQALRTVNRYPDPTCRLLREHLSQRHGIPAEQIVVGNGGDDVLIALAEALLEEDCELVHGWPSFSMYTQIEAITGARAIAVPLTEEHYYDLDAIAGAVTSATRLVIVCNPNNPTSTAVALEQIQALAEQLPKHVCLALDEAYCDFNRLDDPDASIDLLRLFPNLVLLRTFSKAAGLAGLRLGYGLCGNAELPEVLNRIRPPFTTNAVAQAAGIAALKQQASIQERIEETLTVRQELMQGLQQLGFAPPPSQTNFCWFQLGQGHSEAEIINGLAGQGILVRSGTPLGSPNSLRVTCGTPVENRKFLEALESLLAKKR